MGSFRCWHPGFEMLSLQKLAWCLHQLNDCILLSSVCELPGRCSEGQPIPFCPLRQNGKVFPLPKSPLHGLQVAAAIIQTQDLARSHCCFSAIGRGARMLAGVPPLGVLLPEVAASACLMSEGPAIPGCG